MMESITSRGEIDIRSGKPRAVRLALCCNHQFLTFAGECDCNPVTLKERFAIIGASYGWLHNSAGEIRMWQSASGARRAAKAYRCY